MPGPLHPGLILQRDFLHPRQITIYKLGLCTGLERSDLYKICRGAKRMTALTDVLLCQFLGLPLGYFSHVQAEYDVQVALSRIAARVNRESEHT